MGNTVFGFDLTTIRFKFESIALTDECFIMDSIMINHCNLHLNDPGKITSPLRNRGQIMWY